MSYPTIYLTVDAIIVTNKGIVVIKRKHDPFKDMLAFPGGFVEEVETIETALHREVKEETNGDIRSYELLDVFSEPLRDPRRRVVTVAYIVEVSNEDELRAGDDAAEISYLSGDFKDIKLAFDHKQILNTALNHLKATRCG